MSSRVSQCPVCEGIQAGRLQQCSRCQCFFHFPQCGTIPIAKIKANIDGEAWRDIDNLEQRNWKLVEQRDLALCGICSGWQLPLISARRSEKLDLTMAGPKSAKKLTQEELIARQYAALRSSPKKTSPYRNRANEPLKSKKKTKSARKIEASVDSPSLLQPREGEGAREERAGNIAKLEQIRLELRRHESSLRSLESQRQGFQDAAGIASQGQSGQPVVLPRYTLVWLHQELEKLIQRTDQEILSTKDLLSQHRRTLEVLEKELLEIKGITDKM